MPTKPEIFLRHSLYETRSASSCILRSGRRQCRQPYGCRHSTVSASIRHRPWAASCCCHRRNACALAGQHGIVQRLQSCCIRRAACRAGCFRPTRAHGERQAPLPAMPRCISVAHTPSVSPRRFEILHREEGEKLSVPPLALPRSLEFAGRHCPPKPCWCIPSNRAVIAARFGGGRGGKPSACA